MQWAWIFHWPFFFGKVIIWIAEGSVTHATFADCLHYTAIARWMPNHRIRLLIMGFCWMNSLIADLSLFAGNLHIFKLFSCAKSDNCLSHVIHTLISRKTESGIKQDTLLDSWQINSNIKEVVVALEKDLMINETWGTASNHSTFDKDPCERVSVESPHEFCSKNANKATAFIFKGIFHPIIEHLLNMLFTLRPSKI